MTVTLASRISAITFAIAVVLMTWQPTVTVPHLAGSDTGLTASE